MIKIQNVIYIRFSRIHKKGKRVGMSRFCINRIREESAYMYKGGFERSQIFFYASASKTQASDDLVGYPQINWIIRKKSVFIIFGKKLFVILCFIKQKPKKNQPLLFKSSTQKALPESITRYRCLGTRFPAAWILPEHEIISGFFKFISLFLFTRVENWTIWFFHSVFINVNTYSTPWS